MFNRHYLINYTLKIDKNTFGLFGFGVNLSQCMRTLGLISRKCLLLLKTKCYSCGFEHTGFRFHHGALCDDEIKQSYA